MSPVVLLAAGGTGGHLFPAEALAGALARRGFEIELATDERALRYGVKFPARAIHAVPSETLRGRSPADIARFGSRLGRGLLSSVALLRRIKPVVAVGFGGYPTVPPLLAASLLRIPTVVHEQNVVMGRANRLLAKRASLVATGFPVLRGAPLLRRPSVHVGTPVRPAVLAQTQVPYLPPEAGGTIRLLVFGGSQGARVMADVVPAAIALLDADLRARLEVVQQAREEDLERVRAAYADARVAVELTPFIRDLPERMARAHLVIGRAGASTVAELAVIGRPSILVPFPHALDQDQLANACVLGDAGAAMVVIQDRFTPAALAAELTHAFQDRESLVHAAAAARAMGVTDAADRLAEVVVSLVDPARLARGAAPAAVAAGSSAGQQPRDLSQRVAVGSSR